MITPDRLEHYMRRAAGMGRDVVEIQPFVVFLDPQDPLRFFNYAHPLQSIRGSSKRLWESLSKPLAEVRALFVARRRTPRFEYVEQFAPDLAAVLAAAGFSQEGRYPLQICDPHGFRSAPQVPGLTIRQLEAGMPDKELRDFITVERRSFSHRETEEVTANDCEDLRDMLQRGGLAFLAHLDGLSTGVASCPAPLDGLTELTGIGTLPAYRRRGIATAITAEAARVAFDRGVEAAFLAAGDEQAGRVYQKVGFIPHATAIAYWDPAEQEKNRPRLSGTPVVNDLSSRL